MVARLGMVADSAGFLSIHLYRLASDRAAETIGALEPRRRLQRRAAVRDAPLVARVRPGGPVVPQRPAAGVAGVGAVRSARSSAAGRRAASSA